MKRRDEQHVVIIDDDPVSNMLTEMSIKSVHSKDYIRGMWMILQHDTPVDYVLATKHRVTVREFVNMAFKAANLGELRWIGEGINEKGYLKGETCVVVEVSEKYFRPYDLTDLIGDSSKAKQDLSWREEYTLEEIIKEMVNE